MPPLAALTEAYGIDEAHLHLFEALSLIPEKEGAPGGWR